MAFSRRHYRAVSPPSDTPQDVIARVQRLAALTRARDETRAKYPVLTADNVDAALAFQEQRYQALLHTS